MAINRKKLTMTLVKAAVSAGLLAFLIYKINTDIFLEMGEKFNFWWFAPLSLLFITVQFFGSWRWREVLKCHGMDQSIGRGMYLYLVGYFYNNFLPTAIGGDVIRGYEASRQFGRMAKIYGSILVERLLGLLATLTIALIFLPLAMLPIPLVWLIVLLNAVAWGVSIFFFAKKTGTITDKLVHRLPEKIRGKVQGIIDTLREYRDHRADVGCAYVVAVLYQGSLIVVPWVGARLMGIDDVPLSAYMVFVPLIWIISLLPISLNALGLREASFAYFFVLMGSTEEQGFLVSLIFLGTMMLSSLVGGVLWGIVGHRRKNGEEEKVQDWDWVRIK